jgi:anaerobic magnesium-protoporphyrin IX monomethyl ester cyclase
MAKVSLVFPRMRYKSGDPPLGLGYLASALLHSGHDVDLIDTTFHPELSYVKDRLECFGPQVVGVYSDIIMMKDAAAVCSMARDRGSLVVAGGPLAVSNSNALDGYADIVVEGEGEELIVDVANHKYEKHTPALHLLDDHEIDIDSLHAPSWSLMAMDRYAQYWHYLDSIPGRFKGTNIIASRGCCYQCTFCQPTLRKLFGPIVRQRQPSNIIREIKLLHEWKGYNAFFFHDDVFTHRTDRLFEFCDLLDREGLKITWACNSRVDTVDNEKIERMVASGLRAIHFGIEAGTHRVRNEIYKKNITDIDIYKAVDIAHRHKVSSLGFFMIGAPTETEGEIEFTRKMIMSLPLQEITVSLTSPLPGTYLHDYVKKEYTTSDDPADFDYYSKRAFEGGVPYGKLRKIQRGILMQFYLDPKRWRYILRHMTRISGWKRMVAKLGRFR